MEPYKIYDFEDEKAWLKGRLNGIGGSDASAGSGIRTRISRKKFKDILKMSPNVPIKSSNMITSKKQRWFSIRSFS